MSNNQQQKEAKSDSSSTEDKQRTGKESQETMVGDSEQPHPEEHPEESSEKSPEEKDSEAATMAGLELSISDYIIQFVARIVPPGNRREREAAREIISKLDRDAFDGNERAGTIKKMKYEGVEVRIDIQGTFPRKNKRYVNVQVQIKTYSVAGIIVLGGHSFGRQRINNALLESLATQEMVVLDE